MADPIITAQDVVDLVGRGDTSDPGIAIAIAAASDTVRTFTERVITQTDGTATLDGHGGDALLLPQLPVQSVKQRVSQARLHVLVGEVFERGAF